MVEMRWVKTQDGDRVLQYRNNLFGVDANGALCPSGEWSAWTTVPTLWLDDIIERSGSGVKFESVAESEAPNAEAQD